MLGGREQAGYLLPTCYFPPNVYLFAFGLLALLFVFIWIAAVARFGVFVSIVIVGTWLFVSIMIAAVVISTPNWIVNFKPITSLRNGCSMGIQQAFKVQPSQAALALSCTLAAPLAGTVKSMLPSARV